MAYQIVVALIAAAAAIGTAVAADSSNGAARRKAQAHSNAQAKQQRADYRQASALEQKRLNKVDNENRKRYWGEFHSSDVARKEERKMRREKANKESLAGAFQSLRSTINDEAVFKQNMKGLFA